MIVPSIWSAGLTACSACRRMAQCAAVDFAEPRVTAFVCMACVGRMGEVGCVGVIPGTFVMCGEAGNYCSVECQERAAKR